MLYYVRLCKCVFEPIKWRFIQMKTGFFSQFDPSNITSAAAKERRRIKYTTCTIMTYAKENDVAIQGIISNGSIWSESYLDTGNRRK